MYENLSIQIGVISWATIALLIVLMAILWMLYGHRKDHKELIKILQTPPSHCETDSNKEEK